jgi:DNA-binding MurR/RpiR family transcriptional regulator
VIPPQVAAAPSARTQFAPSPVRQLLADAAALLDPPASRLAALLSATGAAADDVGDLARRAGVSPADVDRLLRTAGFADLDALPGPGGSPAGRRCRGDLRPGAGALLRQEQRCVAETAALVRHDEVLDTAAERIRRSRRRWVFGDLAASGYAQLFAAELDSALSQVTRIEPTAAAVLAAIAAAGRRDCLVVYCLGRSSRLTVRVAEQFRDRGATVVAITDAEDSPLDRHADHVLRTANGGRGRHSPAAIAALGLALGTAAAAGAKGAGRRTRRTDELADALGWYASGSDNTDTTTSGRDGDT